LHPKEKPADVVASSHSASVCLEYYPGLILTQLNKLEEQLETKETIELISELCRRINGVVPTQSEIKLN
jgi:hypothetical protein